MWMMPLHLHVNQKSDYDDDDDYKKIGYNINVYIATDCMLGGQPNHSLQQVIR